MSTAGKRAKPGERGSAMLIVFVFAAIIAIMLYKEMPVNIFEAQRNKEQLLVDRGNEYARAVKLYYRKFGIYPPTMDALENTNRIRFLRRKYKDPFTGESNWRLLHAGPAGQLIDSKVNNGGTLAGLTGNNAGSTGNFGGSGNSNNAGSGKSAFGNSNSAFGNSNSGFGSSNSGFGSNSAGSSSSSSSSGFGFSGYSGGWSGGASSTGLPGQSGPNPAIPQRKSAIAATGGQGQAAGTPAASADPTTPLLATSNGQGSGIVDSGAQSGAPGGGDKAAAPGNPGDVARGLIANPNAPTQEGSAPAAAAGSANSAAAANGTGVTSQGTLSAGGIAGVASKVEGHSIKSINDQTNYSLWEFYYDPSKDATRGLSAAAGQQGSGQSAARGQIGASNGAAQPQNAFGDITKGSQDYDPTTSGNPSTNPQQQQTGPQ